ncbi:Coiled-coil domain-containing protein 93 [Blattella germanica]|nr:Coiled-coil domain-containing protein 93 [Blattella germanica]
MSGLGNVFYPRVRNSSKLSTRIDADGKEVEVEVREDEEQKVKLQEIVDLLVAAGYFRARIKGLSSFDKVVGGMTWCIETCNFDVDVDLLFQENLTIGQKIALTEKIVAVLPEMKCPHRIEPHQIQGLDFIHIFPVIQWLVKKSVETREEMGDFVRSYAISQFRRLCPLPEEQNILTQQENILRNIRTIKEVYRPQRRFRRKDAPPEEEESRVQSTLLEYGYNISMLSISAAESGEADEESNQALSHEAQETQRLEEEKGGGSPSSHARALVTLEKQKAALEERESKLMKEKERLEIGIKEQSAQLQQTQRAHEEIDKVLKEMEALETEENQGILRKLQALVILNESLKQQEQEFREQCKLELGKLQKLIKDAHDSATPDENSDQVSSQFEEEKERVQKLRLVLAKRNRSIAALQRQLDEVPGRAELAQYQRRFLELYNQVVNICWLVERRKSEERQRRDKLSQQLLGLVEQQRRYVAAVRQLTIECRRNEALLAQLRGT